MSDPRPAEPVDAEASTGAAASPGRLKVLLGAAPGVGKTVAMLNEAHRRQDRGADVVIGIVETHGREHTAASAVGIPVVPPQRIEHRGITVIEMDVAAILLRRPQIALVDELAHTNAPGSRHGKRWQDVADLLAAGIDVITTVNIQHLESLVDVVQAVTGVRQAETVPDEFVRSAEQIELVDMSPQALRRRLAHGHVYPAERIDAAMGNYFREGNLGALRELALLWVADRVEESLEQYRVGHGITGSWPTRERIVVALTGGPEGEQLLRRGARIAGRVQGRGLAAVHVIRADGSVGARAHQVENLRMLTESLGGTFHLVVGDDLAEAVLEFARSVNGTQIVVGTSRHRAWARLLRPSTAAAIVNASGDVDVHMVTHSAAGRIRHPSRPTRHRAAWILAPLTPLVLTAAMYPWRGDLELAAELLVYLLGVLGVATVGGVLPAVLTALLAGFCANYFFTPPTGSFSVAGVTNVLALLVFLVVGAAVASIVDRSTRRAREADQGRAEAQMLSAVIGGSRGPSSAPPDAQDPVTTVLDRARIAFRMTSVALWQRRPGGHRVLATSPAPGSPDPAAPYPQRPAAPGADKAPLRNGEPEVLVEVDGERTLALTGRHLSAAERAVLQVVAAQALAAVERQELATRAAEADRLRQADKLRTAILAALSHDLRTPLATIKASVSSLRNPALTFDNDDRAEFLAGAEDAVDELAGLVANLLDMSRLQTGAISPVRQPVSLDEVLHRALIGSETGRIDDHVPDGLPLLDTDAGLLERVFANVISNALRHNPSDGRVRLSAELTDREGRPHVQVRICDRGPGVRESDRVAMFRPFQQLGDVPDGRGIGLGLAVARGLADALEVIVEADDTPGGGLTMVIEIPVAA